MFQRRTDAFSADTGELSPLAVLVNWRRYTLLAAISLGVAHEKTYWTRACKLLPVDLHSITSASAVNVLANPQDFEFFGVPRVLGHGTPLGSLTLNSA